MNTSQPKLSHGVSSESYLEPRQALQKPTIPSQNGLKKPNFAIYYTQ